MRSPYHFVLVLLLIVSQALAGCGRGTTDRRSKMAEMTPRVKQMFTKTKTVCFGRFLIDLPWLATVAWGHASIDLGIDIYPGEAAVVNTLQNEFAETMKSTKAIYHGYVPLLLSEQHIDSPHGTVIAGYEQADAINALQMKGFFVRGADGAVISARPMMSERDETLRDIKSLAQRLQFPAGSDISSTPGNCLGGAFVTDEGRTGDEQPNEHVRIGFRLSEFSDTHLSIHIAPSNPNFSKGNSLEFQLSKLEESQSSEDPAHPGLSTRYFRRGSRQVNDWRNGWEVLSRSPDQPDAHGVHDFVLQVQGVPGDLLRPYADIQMQTGVADNLAGAVKPTLTDEEAIAVWDAITSTIRVRPTTTKASAPAAARKPLGERAVTGRICPQTGWWQACEPEAAQALPRQRIEEGTTMPMATVDGKPSLWHKLKGEQPKYKTAAMWQLVAYEG